MKIDVNNVNSVLWLRQGVPTIVFNAFGKFANVIRQEFDDFRLESRLRCYFKNAFQPVLFGVCEALVPKADGFEILAYYYGYVGPVAVSYWFRLVPNK